MVRNQEQERARRRLPAAGFVAALALGLLGLLGPAPAGAQTKLVGNTSGQPTRASAGYVNSEVTYVQAQVFTTGDGVAGYTLGSVSLDAFRDYPDTTLRVSLHAPDSSGRPGAEQVLLSGPSGVTVGLTNPFTAPAGTTLSADTTYFVVVRATGPLAILQSTESHDEDLDSALGWSIADLRYELTDATEWTHVRVDTSSKPLRIVVSGTVVGATRPGRPTGLAARDVHAEDHPPFVDRTGGPRVE